MSRKRNQASPTSAARGDELRRRIRHATFELLTRYGYAGTSTLKIATRAKVSKRELYALFRDKQAILASCISEAAKAIQTPLQLPAVRDRAGVETVLRSFGARALRTLSQPAVNAMFRLAIAESESSPEIARALETTGISATREVLITFLSQAQSEGLLSAAEPFLMAEQFLALLWGSLRIRLLLRVASPPNDEEIDRRARLTADAFLRLHGA